MKTHSKYFSVFSDYVFIFSIKKQNLHNIINMSEIV